MTADAQANRRRLLRGAAAIAAVAAAPALGETARPFRIVAEGLGFPEGPVAMDNGDVVLVEIARGTLSRVRRDGVVEVVAKLGGGPNGAAVGPDGAFYVVNNGGLLLSQRNGRWQIDGVPADFQGGWVDRVDPRSGAVKRLYEGMGANRLKGPNDLVFDTWGGFWMTDTGKSYARSRDHGGLYWGRADGSELREVVYPLLTPNGVALAPDRRTLYVALSEKRQVVAYRLTGPGQIEMDGATPRALVVASLPGDLILDSMAVEAGGNLVLTAVRAGRLIVVNPAGAVVETIPFPEFAVTNLAFGGPDMRTCNVTLSQSGRLVSLAWPRPGLKLLYR